MSWQKIFWSVPEKNSAAIAVGGCHNCHVVYLFDKTSVKTFCEYNLARLTLNQLPVVSEQYSYENDLKSPKYAFKNENYIKALYPGLFQGFKIIFITIIF